MSEKREGIAVVGVGVAACAACCAGPLLGVFAAIGLGTLTGLLLFGVAALAVGAVVLVVVLRHRRTKRQTTQTRVWSFTAFASDYPQFVPKPTSSASVPVALLGTRNHRVEAEQDA